MMPDGTGGCQGSFCLNLNKISGFEYGPENLVLIMKPILRLSEVGPNTQIEMCFFANCILVLQIPMNLRFSR
jgi:hypothetical protein